MYVYIGSLAFNGSWVDVPDNPYLMRRLSSFGEEVTDLRSQKERGACGMSQ